MAGRGIYPVRKVHAYGEELRELMIWVDTRTGRCRTADQPHTNVIPLQNGIQTDGCLCSARVLACTGVNLLRTLHHLL